MMQDIDFDRFAKSSSSYAAAASRDDCRQKKRKSWSYFAVGSVALLLCCAIVVIIRSDQRENTFDELVTTGGAVRRDLSQKVDRIEKCDSEDCQVVKKYILNSLNESVDPCKDFYEFSCGNWVKNNPIPKTSSSFSTFSKLNQIVEKQLRKILENSDSSSSKSTKFLFNMAQDYYLSCKDMKEINKRDKAPLVKLINAVGGWAMGGEGVNFDAKKYDVISLLKDVHANFTSSGGPLFSVHVSDDPKNTTQHIIEVRKVIACFGVRLTILIND